MNDLAMLLIRIDRAERFAAAMTNDAEQQRFENMAEVLENELAAIPEQAIQNMP